MEARFLPAREHGALEGLLDVGLHLRGVVGLDQGLHPRLVLVLRAHRDDVDVGALRVLAGEGVLYGIEAGLGGVVGVDDGGIDVVEHARGLRGVDLRELDLLRVVGDVEGRGLEPDAVLQLDDALVLEKQESPAAVGRIVGDRDARAVAGARRSS